MTAKSEQRERIIQNILNKWDGRFPVGIYWGEFCQVCGQLNTWSGWIGSLTHHYWVRGKGESVCGSCIAGSPAAKPWGFVLSEVGAWVDSVLENRPYRYCGVCGVRVSITVSDSYEGKRWVCLGRLQERRYLEQKYKTIRELRLFDIQLEAQRLDFEEIWDKRLKSKRAERAKAALDELGKVHGTAYKNSDLRRTVM